MTHGKDVESSTLHGMRHFTGIQQAHQLQQDKNKGRVGGKESNRQHTLSFEAGGCGFGDVHTRYTNMRGFAGKSNIEF